MHCRTVSVDLTSSIYKYQYTDYSRLNWMQSYVNSFRVQIYRMWFMSSHDCRVLTLHC